MCVWRGVVTGSTVSWIDRHYQMSIYALWSAEANIDKKLK